MPAPRIFTCPKCTGRIRTRRAFTDHFNKCTLSLQISVLIQVGNVDITTECWEWREVLTGSAGYGKYGGVYAHRIACEFNGRPKDIEVLHALHSCDNPPCINPSHLRWGTERDNKRDCVIRGRWNGHRGNAHWTKINPEMNPWSRKGVDRHWDAWPESRRAQYQETGGK